MLSGLSRGAGVVLAAKNEAALKHIEFVPLEPTKALVVLVVAERRRREPRRSTLPAGITASQLHEASNYLNAHIRGRTLAEAEVEIARLQATRPRPRSTADAGAGRGGPGGLGRRRERPAGALIVRGRANLLENVTAQDDLELHPAAVRRPGDAGRADPAARPRREGPGVRIFIGSENKLFSLSGSSLVVAPYRDKERASSARSASSARPGSTMPASCRWSTTRRSWSAACCAKPAYPLIFAGRTSISGANRHA